MACTSSSSLNGDEFRNGGPLLAPILPSLDQYLESRTNIIHPDIMEKSPVNNQSTTEASPLDPNELITASESIPKGSLPVDIASGSGKNREKLTIPAIAWDLSIFTDPYLDSNNSSNSLVEQNLLGTIFRSYSSPSAEDMEFQHKRKRSSAVDMSGEKFKNQKLIVSRNECLSVVESCKSDATSKHQATTCIPTALPQSQASKAKPANPIQAPQRQKRKMAACNSAKDLERAILAVQLMDKKKKLVRRQAQSGLQSRLTRRELLSNPMGMEVTVIHNAQPVINSPSQSEPLAKAAEKEVNGLLIDTIFQSVSTQSTKPPHVDTIATETRDIPLIKQTPPTSMNIAQSTQPMNTMVTKTMLINGIPEMPWERSPQPHADDKREKDTSSLRPNRTPPIDELPITQIPAKTLTSPFESLFVDDFEAVETGVPPVMESLFIDELETKKPDILPAMESLFVDELEGKKPDLLPVLERLFVDEAKPDKPDIILPVATTLASPTPNIPAAKKRKLSPATKPLIRSPVVEIVSDEDYHETLQKLPEPVPHKPALKPNIWPIPQGEESEISDEDESERGLSPSLTNESIEERDAGLNVTDMGHQPHGSLPRSQTPNPGDIYWEYSVRRSNWLGEPETAKTVTVGSFTSLDEANSAATEELFCKRGGHPLELYSELTMQRDENGMVRNIGTTITSQEIVTYVERKMKWRQRDPPAEAPVSILPAYVYLVCQKSVWRGGRSSERQLLAFGDAMLANREAVAQVKKMALRHLGKRERQLKIEMFRKHLEGLEEAGELFESSWENESECEGRTDMVWVKKMRIYGPLN
ncbi:MAG: hypothetical protein M1829_001942 [Trizodia sp. TS-e1964]|nr:MAG: hypothetical protein M1829_001942 [Trizodia sp. TS-e1964]